MGPTPRAVSRVSWLALVWQNVMAMASASAVSSGRGTAGRGSRMRGISCTCFLTALPYPVTPRLTCLGGYSYTGRPARAAARRVNPRGPAPPLTVVWLC